jgi:hypothetical protein
MTTRLKDDEKTLWMAYADGEVLGCGEKSETVVQALFLAYQKDLGLDDAQREDLFLDLKLGDWFVVDPVFCSSYRQRAYFVRKVPKL